MTIPRRPVSSFTVLVASCLVLTGCGGSDNATATPRPSGSLSRVSAIHGVITCLIDKGIITKRELKKAKWYNNGHANTTNPSFEGWFVVRENKQYDGKSLEAWVDDAQQSWPKEMCGPRPTYGS